MVSSVHYKRAHLVVHVHLVCTLSGDYIEEKSELEI